ncbi:MAG: hypothetical protein M3521_14075 [Acidobacteriota bacterium]|nr:hypothetical protein [Acidobacteriota bacterium]
MTKQIPEIKRSKVLILRCCLKYDGRRLTEATATERPIKIYSVPSCAKMEMPNSGRMEMMNGIAKQCTAQSHETIAPVLSNKPFELRFGKFNRIAF